MSTTIQLLSKFPSCSASTFPRGAATLPVGNNKSCGQSSTPRATKWAAVGWSLTLYILFFWQKTTSWEYIGPEKDGKQNLSQTSWMFSHYPLQHPHKGKELNQLCSSVQQQECSRDPWINVSSAAKLYFLFSLERTFFRPFVLLKNRTIIPICHFIKSVLDAVAIIQGRSPMEAWHQA